jgi:hypothetical protein
LNPATVSAPGSAALTLTQCAPDPFVAITTLPGVVVSPWNVTAPPPVHGCATFRPPA